MPGSPCIGRPQSPNGLQVSLRRLHNNLGHPTNQQLIRVLKHGGASEAALIAARAFSCDQCQAQKQPKIALPSQVNRVTEFNALVGVDVKYLSGWVANKRIPAVNMVDYASSLQVMVPIFQKETAETLRHVFMERWVSWAGMPQEIILDPARANMSDAFTSLLEQGGATFKLTAADAHWQLGKCEVHGGWFNRVLEKVLSEHAPSTQSDWVECVHAAHCKNQLFQVYGMTPSQFVFGKNPRIPENLMDEPLDVIPATASLYEDAVARQVAIRQSARRAVLELQDSKSLRLALTARPRVSRTYEAGTYVAYWRTQKWVHGALEKTGRWCGPAVVLGYVGRNVVVIHKRQIFRCAPEQVRCSTEDELKLVETPKMELLGIKHLIESEQLNSRQYIDLVPESYPPEDPATPVNAPDQQVTPQINESARRSIGEEPKSLSAHQEPSSESGAQGSSDPWVPEVGMGLPPHMKDKASDFLDTDLPMTDASSPAPTVPAEKTPETLSYGPVRRRVTQKDGPMALYRPERMAQEDFQEMMQEIVPELLKKVIPADQPDDTDVAMESRGVKRPPSPEPDPSDPPEKRLNVDDETLMTEHQSSPAGVTFACDEVTVLSVQAMERAGSSYHTNDGLNIKERQELADRFLAGESHEALVAAYMKKKKSAKELPPSGNPPELQRKIDEAKIIEWGTITAKHAGRVAFGPEAAEIRRCHPDRIMGSRFVITIKQEDDAAPRTKARWCLQGHLDPDLSVKAAAGDLQSPTLAQASRNLVFQLLATHHWELALGDIKGAFLASGDLPQRYKPLYASLPKGGIPGVPEDALIEVLGHVYGLNDSPSAWYRKLSSELLRVGFEKSQFDSCLFFFREHGKLQGVYGVHVDDCVTGGQGKAYHAAIQELRKTFEFRKWRIGEGDFCGSQYKQCPKSFAITMSQEKFVQKIRPLHMSRERARDRSSELTEKEISCLRAINGSLNWLANQSRPDVATQVSFAQQSFPRPTVGDAINANHAVRRAKQHADQVITFSPIPLDRLGLMCHSDAAFGNAKAGATQAGYIISFVDAKVNEGHDSSWSPCFWKSFRLPRVVSSTLSAESQSMSVASSMLEWSSLLLSEAVDGPRFSQALWSGLGNRLTLLITDCKSLYDHLLSQSSPTLDDRRTSIDIIILRESIARLKAQVRWIPTDRMLADALTKESAEAFDLLRSCLRAKSYQISPEGLVLERRAAEKDRRKSFAAKDDH